MKTLHNPVRGFLIKLVVTLRVYQKNLLFTSALWLETKKGKKKRYRCPYKLCLYHFPMAQSTSSDLHFGASRDKFDAGYNFSTPTRQWSWASLQRAWLSCHQSGQFIDGSKNEPLGTHACAVRSIINVFVMEHNFVKPLLRSFARE